MEDSLDDSNKMKKAEKGGVSGVVEERGENKGEEKLATKEGEREGEGDEKREGEGGGRAVLDADFFEGNVDFALPSGGEGEENEEEAMEEGDGFDDLDGFPDD